MAKKFKDLRDKLPPDRQRCAEVRTLLMEVFGISQERAAKMVDNLRGDPQLLAEVVAVTLAVKRSGESVDRMTKYINKRLEGSGYRV